ncbi:MAG: DUF11 domain-containing protein [Acidimicrobiia bacterium]|nr:DUF11 domain-containing protein [Acidimicrobiia bacterium]
MIRTLTYRFSSMRKIWKANFALFLLLVLAIGMLPSYAGVNTKTSSAKAFASGDCGARIAVSLDRSSSIGVSEFGGSQANVDTIKRGVTLLNNSIIGPDSYTDYYTFASASRRVNTGGWFNLKDQTASNWQNQIVSGVKFKTGATNYSSGDLYDDGLAANSEGLTNWEGAITNILSSRQDPFPDAIIMFTDGEPTTNNAETRAAVAAGGTYTAAGIPNADGTDPDDLAAAYNAADFARAAGVRVIPVAIGDFSGDNYSHLVRLAGGGKVYTSRSLNDLGNLLKLAAADVCKTPTRLAFSAFEKTAPGTFVNRSIPITITGPAAGTVTTTGDPLNPWATKTFNTATDWDMRARAGIPAGYHPISERCERDKWDGKAPILAEAGDSVGVNGQILIQNQKPGGTTYCEFVYEKNPVIPVSTVGVRIMVKGSNGSLSPYAGTVNLNATNIFQGNVTTISSGDGYVVKSGKPTTKFSADLSIANNIPNNYRVISGDKCVALGSSTPLNDSESAKDKISTSNLAPGSNTRCEFIIELLPAKPAALSIIKKVNGQDAPVSNPVQVRIGDKLIYSFDIKNIGQIPVKNINLTDSTLTSKRSDALADCVSSLNGRVLAVNETFTCNSREITVPTDSPKTVKNIAIANGTGVVLPGQSPSNPAQVQDDANIKIIKPIVTIDKKVNPSVLSYDGQTVTYTITAKNTGDASYEGTITDSLFGLSKTVSIEPNNGSITITLVGKFDLANRSITFLKSQNNDLSSNKTVSISNNSLINTACIKEVNICDNATIDVADLSITKTAVPTNLIVTQNGKYVISIKNTGKALLNNTVIKDDTLKALFASANDGVNNNVKTQYSITDPGVFCDKVQNDILEIGETCTVNINYTMTEKLYKEIKGTSQSNTVTFANTASVNAKTVIDGQSLTRQDDATITVTATPSLTINKKVSEKVVTKAGDTVTYTITVKNTGTGDATNVTVYERGLGVNFGPFNINAGQKVVINVVATYDGNNTLTFTRDNQVIATKQFTDGKFKNIACLSPTGTVPCSPEVTVYEPGLKLDKSANATTYSINDNVIYTFKLTNTGATALGNVKLNDNTIPTLFTSAGESNPPKTSFITSDFSGDTNNNGLLDLSETWTVNATFKMTQKLSSYIESHDSNAQLAGAQFKNIAIAKADVVVPGTTTPDTTKPVGPVQDDAEITVNLNPGLEVTKATSKTVAVDGDTYTYTITVKNIGTSKLNNVIVKDNNVGFNTTISTLAVGETKTFVIDASVRGNTITFKYNGTLTSKTGTFDASGRFVNVACAESGDVADCSPEVLVKTPKITLEKTVKGNSTIRVGETITYQFIVTNVNEVPIKDLVITDETLKTLFGLSGIPTINIDNSKLGTDGVLTKDEKSQVVEYTTPVVTSAIAAKFINNKFTNIAIVNGKAVLDDGSTKAVKPAQDDAVVNLELQTSWTFNKVADNHVARPGDTITYSFTVKNTGETTIPSITITDNTIAKTIVVAGPIAPGATKTATTTYVLPANYTGTNFVNVANACITGTTDCKPGTDKVLVPKVQLDKSGPAVAMAGDKVTYKFVVKNIGETDLTNIVITDQALSTLLGKEVKISVPGILKPGESSSIINYDATFPANFSGKSFKNVAIVTAIPLNPKTNIPETDKPVTDDDDHTILFAQWHATKTADKIAVKPGETINYIITVYNDSDVALTDVEVSDPTIGFPADGKPVKVNIPANSKVEIPASYVVPVNYVGNTFKNVALVCVPRTGQDANCEKPTVEVPVVKLTIVKSADKKQVLVGDEVTFSFDVTNNSTIDLKNVRVVDSKVNFDEIITLLKAGQKVTIKATNKYIVTEADLEAEKLTNIVSACAVIPGRDISDASDCTPSSSGVCIEKADTVCDDDEITIPVISPSISIVKSADQTTASVGDTVNYSFVITNTSKIEINDITVTDNVLGDLGAIEKLAPGASVTKTIAYVVPAGIPQGILRNVASACFASPVVVNNCDSDDHVLSITEVLGQNITRISPSGMLAYTGSTSDYILRTVLWLMLLGSTFVMFAFRKKRTV